MAAKSVATEKTIKSRFCNSEFIKRRIQSDRAWFWVLLVCFLKDVFREAGPNPDAADAAADGFREAENT